MFFQKTSKGTAAYGRNGNYKYVLLLLLLLQIDDRNSWWSKQSDR